MNDVLNVNVKEDLSVVKMLNKTAKKLNKQYSKKRVINEKYLKQSSKVKNVFSIIFDVLSVLLMVLCAIICFANINCRIQNCPPSFFGYSAVKVATSSMVDSGLNVNETVVVQSVNTSTLKGDHYVTKENGEQQFVRGDIIAFYLYDESYNSFDINHCYLLTLAEDELPNLETTTSFLRTFGVYPSAMREAGKSGSNIIIHHIKDVRIDDNGVRWFKTYGSSNLSDNLPNGGVDSWYVCEDMVVGVKVDGVWTNGLANALGKLTSSTTLIFVILIPVVLIAIIIVLESLKDVQIAKLELDCVEEKRKITDEICVKNNVGFNMDTKTKYKVLATAPEDEKLTYISLLWKDGSAPESIRKYYLRKGIILRPMKKILNVHRECEQMFKNNVQPYKIAKYYTEQRSKIEKEAKKQELRIKNIVRKNVK